MRALFRSGLWILAMAAVPSLRAGIVPCPSTVGDLATYPSSDYVCQETDNLWFSFVDVGAATTGYSPLPAGTIFHIDLVGPQDLAITLELSGLSKFQPGLTYAWSFFVVEDSFGNVPLVSADSDYGAQGSSPTLTTVVNAMTVDSYNPNGAPSVTLGAEVGQLTNTTGALMRLNTGPTPGLKFTNTLTGIQPDTTM